ncbi:MAG: mechanosensitive ion channel family protein [Candidatus Thorarchaeota archaeon]
MKKRYYALLYILLIAILFWVFYLSGWDQLIVDLIVISVIFYILRKPFSSLLNYLVKKRLYRAIILTFYNIAWAFFLFWLLWVISNEVFIAIISFLITAISLNFRIILNNITSGTLLLTAGQFEVGDLIETNEVQGIIQQINLNYTKIREFDGVTVQIPNSQIYGSTVVKFTHEKFKIFEPIKKEEFKKKKYYKEYIKLFNKIISSNIKTTIYVKQIEILGTLSPEDLDGILSGVFDLYEPIFGLRPDYSVDTTTFGRGRLNLYIKSDKPLIVLNYLDAFLRDLLFKLYPDELLDGWDSYQGKHSIKKLDKGGNES